MTQNPFTQPEDLEPWLEQSQKYSASREKSLHTFLKHRQSKQISYSPISIFMNTFHKYTLSTLVAGVILSSTVGALAAETLAPEQYKPSSIFNFSANKQADKNPYTALAPDENNYVANLDSCDLALKFPKSIENQNLYYSKLQSDQKKDGAGYAISKGGEFLFSIACLEKDEFGILPPDIKLKNLSVNDLRERTGWLITQANISEIKEYSHDQASTINFKYNSKYYSVAASQTSSIKNVNNLIQIQFNSLVTNKISDNLPSLPTNKLNNGLDKIETSFAKELRTMKNESNIPGGTSSLFISEDKDRLNGDVIIEAGIKTNPYPTIDEINQTYQNIVPNNLISEYPMAALVYGDAVNVEAKDIPEFKISDPQNTIKSIKMLDSWYKKSPESPLYYLVETKDGYTFTITLNKPEIIQQTFDLKINFK
jgi:hypothetical protein